MNSKRLTAVTLLVVLVTGLSGGLLAQTPAQTAPTQATNDDVAALKALLVEQQKQIDQLKSALEDEQKAIERVSNSATASAQQQPVQTKSDFTLPRDKALGEVASTTPYIPAAAAVPTAVASPIAGSASPIAVASPAAAQPPAGATTNPCEAVPDGPAPAFIRIGSTCLVPIGFMDDTFVWRDKNAGSGIGSNFGSVPYNNTVAGRTSEDRFSIQNSRIGFRFDGDWKGTHFIGYNEWDFLGTSGATNITVTNGAVVPRIRLYWVDVRKGKIEFLAGQSWSMMTPNRRGISPFPGDIFYSQVMDVNYMAGLTWTRQPGLRILFHPNNAVTWGFSAENPDQYIGGYGGAGAPVLPAAFTGLSGSQLDQGNLVFAAPQLTPDFISKIAFDPTARFHAEVGGVLDTFKIINPNSPGLALGQTSTKTGGGVLAGINGEIFPGLRLITTNYWSDGGGRYLFGQAPDLAVTAAGTLSLLHAGGTVDGFEATIKNTLLFAYYGGIYIGRDVIIDANGSKVGYGYSGSANSQNRAIQEITMGFNQTMWRNPRYGAINLIGQYEYLMRMPWYVAIGAPDKTHDNTIYFDVRYTLPGGMPNF